MPLSKFSYEEYDSDTSESPTEAFNAAIEERDVFLGRKRCIICGGTATLQHCNIIGADAKERGNWDELLKRGWIPSQAHPRPELDPRNGLLMCPNHRAMFDECEFFLRFLPDTEKFVLINYSDLPDLEDFHGKAVALQVTDRFSPFPTLFVMHEYLTRGNNPFTPVNPRVPNEILWQSWINSDDLWDNTSKSFRRSGPGDTRVTVQIPQFLPAKTDADASFGTLPPLNTETIAKIIAATQSMPSWKTEVTK